ncbi:hypothetical protein SESBI_20306 [Sesbania bispinosa]|nr:hypothetical protein SESBI_20306 [Sesbania bispinosa]
MKNSEVVRRAWNRLRLALLWARKRGALRRRVVLKCLGHTTTPITQSHYYYERELSFDKTPIFHVKMYRPPSMCFSLPRIPCINPQIDFEDDIKYEHEMGSGHHDEEYYCGYQEEEAAAEIDKRAEEFIAKFHQQMKLQRQISSLQYNETPNRDSTSL